ncbi:WecB/TagA/CpsF family glycosyltransferase [Algoriphagus aquatilis]|uniref:WecB/TagA/CpsF family glycosyltransferase n=1 Tax=Algoriphagus aquatilis TaxID=490186 RepID=A0ABW0BVS6_9BACT
MTEFLEYNITLNLPNQLPERQLIANTINPHSYCVAKEDEVFNQALLTSDILVPDGVGVVWATKLLYNRKIAKISGFDLHLHFLELLQKNGGGRVFYLGSSPTTLFLIRARIEREYPKVKVGIWSPPFKEEFTVEDNQEMISKVNSFQPDVLFVGMTAPKQEKWVHYNKAGLDSKVICSIGAVFDFYAGTVKRPNEFWIKLGLEWLPRFLKEPRRLWRRNLISTPKFVLEMIRIKNNLF